MDTKSSDEQTPRRIRVDIPGPVAEALSRLALREDRTTEYQVLRFIREGLTRAGVLGNERDPRR